MQIFSAIHRRAHIIFIFGSPLKKKTWRFYFFNKDFLKSLVKEGEKDMVRCAKPIHPLSTSTFCWFTFWSRSKLIPAPFGFKGRKPSPNCGTDTGSLAGEIQPPGVDQFIVFFWCIVNQIYEKALVFAIPSFVCSDWARLSLIGIAEWPRAVAVATW